MELNPASAPTRTITNVVRAKNAATQSVQRIMNGIGPHQSMPQPPLNKTGKYLNASA